MIRTTIAAVLCSVAGMAWASPPEPRVASCDTATAGRCYEYGGESAGMLAIARTSCDALHAAWREEPCPTARRIAHCARAEAGATRAIHFYPPATAKDAKLECASGDMNVRLE